LVGLRLNAAHEVPRAQQQLIDPLSLRSLEHELVSAIASEDWTLVELSSSDVDEEALELIEHGSTPSSDGD
jgi:hypothetical protein